MGLLKCPNCGKRFFAFALIVILLLAIPFNISVFAASNTYDLDELGLQVTIPTDYSVITRDTPANAPIFSDLGTTKTELISYFETGNIYLNAISNYYNEEIVVTNMKNDLSDFSTLSDSALTALVSTIPERYAEIGISVLKYEIYQHSQTKFVKLYFTDTGNTVYGLQYYTIYDGNAMNFTMRSYQGSISERQESTIKAVVDSIKYDKEPPVVEEGEDTNAFTHTDTDTGVKFTVPANWKQEAFTADREYIDVMFVSTKEDVSTIIYGSTDLWDMMTASEQRGLTRSDINNSAFTRSDVAEMFGITTDKVTTVTYNGISYYKCEVTGFKEVNGHYFTITMTLLLHIDNGWGYVFQFGGTSTHKQYFDFESLIKSVQYPIVSKKPTATSTGTTSNRVENTNNNSYNNTGIIIIVVLLLVAAVIVVAIKKNSKPIPPNNSEMTIYCRNCGQAMPSDSEFCHICGTKVEKENKL